MGSFMSKSQRQQVDLTSYIGKPYPFALMKMHDKGIRAYLVAIKAGEDYHPSAELDTKNAVIILYDAATANVVKCIRT